MAITTYAELQASVATWMHRTDLTTVIPDFITLAETRLNGDLVARSMEITTTLTCSTVSRFLTLPTDLLEMKRIMLSSVQPAVVLEYKSPDQLTQDAPYLTSTGQPVCFTITGSQIELAPPPDSAYTVDLLYQQRLPALSVSNTTNWLLTANPNAYLFGALVASTAYTQDEEHLPVWERKYQEALAATNNVDWYSGTTMRVKAR